MHNRAQYNTQYNTLTQQHAQVYCEVSMLTFRRFLRVIKHFPAEAPGIKLNAVKMAAEHQEIKDGVNRLTTMAGLMMSHHGDRKHIQHSTKTSPENSTASAGSGASGASSAGDAGSILPGSTPSPTASMPVQINVKMLEDEYLLLHSADPRLLPRSRFMQAWKGLLLFVLYYNMISAPLRLVMWPHESRGWIGLDVALDVFLVMDCLFQTFLFPFITPRGETIATPAVARKLFWQHGSLKGQVLAVALWPVQVILLLSGNFWVAAYARVVVVPIAPRIMTKLLNFFEIEAGPSNNSLRSLGRTFSRLFVVTHLVGCGFLLLAQVEGGYTNGSSWLSLGTHTDLTGASAFTKYLRSVYWALTTLTCVCFGDIVPVTNAETVYTIVVIILGLFVVSSVVGDLISIISNMNHNERHLSRHLQQIHEYCQVRGVPEELQGRMHYYMVQAHRDTKGLDMEELFRETPLRLRYQVACAMWTASLEHQPLFIALPLTLVQRLTVCLRSHMFTPGEHICKQGDVGHRLFLVNGGEIIVRTDKVSHKRFVRRTVAEVAHEILKQSRKGSWSEITQHGQKGNPDAVSSFTGFSPSPLPTPKALGDSHRVPTARDGSPSPPGAGAKRSSKFAVSHVAGLGHAAVANRFSSSVVVQQQALVPPDPHNQSDIDRMNKLWDIAKQSNAHQHHHHHHKRHSHKRPSSDTSKLQSQLQLPNAANHSRNPSESQPTAVKVHAQPQAHGPPQVFIPSDVQRASASDYDPLANLTPGYREKKGSINFHIPTAKGLLKKAFSSVHVSKHHDAKHDHLHDTHEPSRCGKRGTSPQKKSRGESKSVSHIPIRSGRSHTSCPMSKHAFSSINSMNEVSRSQERSPDVPMKGRKFFAKLMRHGDKHRSSAFQKTARQRHAAHDKSRHLLSDHYHDHPEEEHWPEEEILIRYGPGDLFGEVSFFLNTLEEHDSLAAHYSTVLILERSDFNKVMKGSESLIATMASLSKENHQRSKYTQAVVKDNFTTSRDKLHRVLIGSSDSEYLQAKALKAIKQTLHETHQAHNQEHEARKRDKLHGHHARPSVFGRKSVNAHDGSRRSTHDAGHRPRGSTHDSESRMTSGLKHIGHELREGLHSVSLNTKAAVERAARKANQLEDILARQLHAVEHALHGYVPPFWVLDPSSNIRVFWDFVVLLTALYAVVSIPLRICFFSQVGIDTHRRWMVADWCLDAVFICNLPFQMFSLAFIDPMSGVRISRPWSIFKRFAKTVRFKVDVFMAIPWDLLALGMPLSVGTRVWWCAIFRLPKMLHLTTVFSVLASFYPVLEFNSRRSSFATLSKGQHRVVTFAFYLLLEAHLLACVWFLIGNWGLQRFDKTWTLQNEVYLSNVGATDMIDSFLGLYTRSLYFVVGALTTVGFGDIVATNDFEVAMCLPLILLAVALFSHVTAGFEYTFHSKTAGFDQKNTYLDHFMRSRSMPQAFRHNVHLYHAYILHRSKGMDEAELLSPLSPQLRMDAMMVVNRDIIEKVAFFDGCSLDFIKSIGTALEAQIFVPGSRLIISGTTADGMFFLKSGLVLKESDDFEVEVKPGDFFGEEGLMDRGVRSADHTALKFCEVFFLSHEDYNRCLTFFPQYGKTLLWRMKAHSEKKEQLHRVFHRKGRGQRTPSQKAELLAERSRKYSSDSDGIFEQDNLDEAPAPLRASVIGAEQRKSLAHSAAAHMLSLHRKRQAVPRHSAGAHSAGATPQSHPPPNVRASFGIVPTPTNQTTGTRTSDSSQRGRFNFLKRTNKVSPTASGPSSRRPSWGENATDAKTDSQDARWLLNGSGGSGGNRPSQSLYQRVLRGMGFAADGDSKVPAPPLGIHSPDKENARSTPAHKMAELLNVMTPTSAHRRLGVEETYRTSLVPGVPRKSGTRKSGPRAVQPLSSTVQAKTRRLGDGVISPLGGFGDGDTRATNRRLKRSSSWNENMTKAALQQAADAKRSRDPQLALLDTPLLGPGAGGVELMSVRGDLHGQARQRLNTDSGGVFGF